MSHEPHEHQFPESDVDGTLVCYPCLLCGLPVGDALKQAAEDRRSLEAEPTDLRAALAGANQRIVDMQAAIDAGRADEWRSDRPLAAPMTPSDRIERAEVIKALQQERVSGSDHESIAHNSGVFDCIQAVRALPAWSPSAPEFTAETVTETYGPCFTCSGVGSVLAPPSGWSSSTSSTSSVCSRCGGSGQIIVSRTVTSRLRADAEGRG